VDHDGRHAREIVWRATRALLNRAATAEMDHAALLLGYDIALGHGREGVFRRLALQVGTELGRAVRYGKPGYARARWKPSSWDSASSSDPLFS
jgi:hypothetical protein